MRPTAVTGARAVIYLNGIPFAWCTGVSYNVVTLHEEIATVDDSLPAELAPTRIRVQGNLKIVRVANQTSATIKGIQSTAGVAFLSNPYVTLEILDRGTNATLLFLPKVKVNQRQGGIDARSLGQEVWDFAGIGFWDESTPK